MLQTVSVTLVIVTAATVLCRWASHQACRWAPQQWRASCQAQASARLRRLAGAPAVLQVLKANLWRNLAHVRAANQGQVLMCPDHRGSCNTGSSSAHFCWWRPSTLWPSASHRLAMSGRRPAHASLSAAHATMVLVEARILASPVVHCMTVSALLLQAAGNRGK